MAYATVADLAARWKPLDEDEAEAADSLLEDAAAMLDSMVTVDPDDARQARALLAVSCSMVRRAMASTSAGVYGVTQGSISADVYSQSLTFGNPAGDMYVTTAERRMIGAGRGFVASIPARAGVCRGRL